MFQAWNFIKLKDFQNGVFGQQFQVVRREDDEKFMWIEVNISQLSAEDVTSLWEKLERLLTLNHCNVVNYYQTAVLKIEGSQSLCCVSQWFDTNNMREAVTQRSGIFLDEVQIVQWSFQLTSGLDYLHRSQLIHCDIRPQNIYICSNGNCKLGSLGIVLTEIETREEDGNDVLLLDMLRYFAPELWTHPKVFSEKTDIWSLGCVMFFLCTLQDAFPAETKEALHSSICNDQPPPLPHSYSWRLRHSIEWMLSIKEKERLSVENVLNELQRVKQASYRSSKAESLALDAGYQIIQSIGTGAYGEVFLVESLSTSQRYAMKVFKQQNPNSEQIMERELQIASKMNHPNIVRWIETQYDNGQPNLIMEYCGGGDMSKHLKAFKTEGRQMEATQILQWFSQMTLAVAYLHEKQMIHRDIKPSNIFVTEDEDRVKLGDFGLARILDVHPTHTLTYCGTMSYMAPELWDPAPYNEKVDIWSLGCVWYEMYTLEPAFTGLSVADIMRSILFDKPKPCDRLDFINSKQLMDAILSKDPQNRPSITEIAVDPVLKGDIRKYATSDQVITFYYDNSPMVSENSKVNFPCGIAVTDYAICPADDQFEIDEKLKVNQRLGTFISQKSIFRRMAATGIVVTFTFLLTVLFLWMLLKSSDVTYEPTTTTQINDSQSPQNITTIVEDLSLFTTISTHVIPQKQLCQMQWKGMDPLHANEGYHYPSIDWNTLSYDKLISNTWENMLASPEYDTKLVLLFPPLCFEHTSAVAIVLWLTRRSTDLCVEGRIDPSAKSVGPFNVNISMELVFEELHGQLRTFRRDMIANIHSFVFQVMFFADIFTIKPYMKATVKPRINSLTIKPVSLHQKFWWRGLEVILATFTERRISWTPLEGAENWLDNWKEMLNSNSERWICFPPLRFLNEDSFAVVIFFQIIESKLEFCATLHPNSDPTIHEKYVQIQGSLELVLRQGGRKETLKFQEPRIAVRPFKPVCEPTSRWKISISKVYSHHFLPKGSIAMKLL